MQLSEILLEQGLLDSAGLERALKAQRELGDDLGDILIKLGIVSEGSLAAALARQHGLPLAAKADYPTAPLYLSKVSLNFLKASKIVPLRERDGGLALAMVNPADDYAIKAMAMLTGMPIHPCVGTQKEIESALNSLYGDGRSSLDRIIDDAGQERSGDNEEDIERLKDLASEAPIVRLVN
ncbi:MAG TPA: type II secretion system protein GspE, partial [Gammaproteobacteria bacterium]|nr:type II secretion system protein GspE [Gammaproteobacteria bacterium]